MKKTFLFFAVLFLIPTLAFGQACEVTIDGYNRCHFDITDYEGMSEPATSDVGKGRVYFDTAAGKLKCSEDGSAYANCFSSSVGISNVVEDATPQLGGDLDVNTKNIDFPTTANISDVLDEDNMASNSATKLATQQSIKAYADTKAPATAPTFATSITGSFLTASEMLITDADKKIVSAAVATYPSLTELSYVKGLSSALQTQINAKAPSTSPTFATSVTGSYLTASEILITDADKKMVSAAVATYPSLTELSYVKGLSSAIQTQLNAKDAVTTAGRSLTRTTNDFAADAELYTFTMDKTIETPTNVDNFIIGRVPLASTVTSIYCIVEAATSATMRIDECDTAADNCAGIDGATTIAADVDGQADDGALSNAGIDAGDWIRMVVTATVGTPGHVTCTVTGTRDD